MRDESEDVVDVMNECIVVAALGITMQLGN
jgi:hypothetical protein